MDFKTLILQFLNTNDSTINVVNQDQITENLLDIQTLKEQNMKLNQLC